MFSEKSCADGIQPVSCDSPTLELALGTCVPSELKPEVVVDPSCVETTIEEAAISGAVVMAEMAAKEKLKQPRNSNKQKKQRKTQLSSLQDSLSQYFSAEGERKRTPVQYTERDFLFESYQPLSSHMKRVKMHQSSTHSQQESTSQRSAKEVEAVETPPTSVWPTTCNRFSNYHLSGSATLLAC